MAFHGVLAQLTLAFTVSGASHPSPTLVPAEPLPQDTDRDGVSDRVELARGTDPQTHGIFPGAYPHIPEPMMFDLVRGLGAKKGEFEFNTLVWAQFQPYGGVAWAPEIEWAFADRYALEFELPMKDGHVEALKLAIQGTMAEARPQFIHGWQVIGEARLRDRAFEATALYLAGRRLGKRVSLFGMLGPQARARAEGVHVSLVANPSLFVDLHEILTIGVENNGVIDGVRSRVRVVPQLHVQVHRHVRLQLGGGVEVSREGVAPIAALRAVIE